MWEPKLGGAANPLLVSVRSGAPVSMPGMMDTILNLGLNDQSVDALIETTGDARFARDSYRRLIQMFGNVVMGVPSDRFEDLLGRMKLKRGVTADVDLDGDALAELVAEYQELYRAETGDRFPQGPREQLDLRSRRCSSRGTRRGRSPTGAGSTSPTTWEPRSTCSRWCSATPVSAPEQASRSPATLPPARPTPTVSSSRTRRARMSSPVLAPACRWIELGRLEPEAYRSLLEVMTLLENHYGDMQDLEFTVDQGRLYMLQTRSGKRDPRAALRIAVDMVAEGVIERDVGGSPSRCQPA